LDSSAPDWDARNAGIVDDEDQPYPDLVTSIRTVNAQVRNLARSASFDLDSIAWETTAFTAPATPTEFSLARRGKTITLNWQLGRESDLAGYVIYRDDQPVATTTHPSWTDTNISGEHSYRVAAYDVNSNTSEWSAPAH